MRKSRFSDEQIVSILREADRTSVAEVVKKSTENDVSQVRLTTKCEMLRALYRSYRPPTLKCDALSTADLYFVPVPLRPIAVVAKSPDGHRRRRCGRSRRYRLLTRPINERRPKVDRAG